MYGWMEGDMDLLSLAQDIKESYPELDFAECQNRARDLLRENDGNFEEAELRVFFN